MENKQIFTAEEVKEKILSNHDNADIIFKWFVVDKLDKLGLKAYYIDKKLDDLLKK